MTKRYYRIINIYDTFSVSQAWHCSDATLATLNYDAIIPLERKPRKEEIREGA